MFLLLTNHEEKKKFDKVLKNQYTFKNIAENKCIVFSHLKMPFMVADRELLQEWTIYHDIKGFDIVIVLRSVEDE